MWTMYTLNSSEDNFGKKTEHYIFAWTFLHEHIYFQLGVFSTFNAVLASMLHSHAEIFKILFGAIWVNSCNTERDKRHHNKAHKHLYVVKHRKWELIVHSDWIVLLQFYKIQLTMTRNSTFLFEIWILKSITNKICLLGYFVMPMWNNANFF